MTSLTNKMELIKIAVDRFLGWKLPDDFNPDGGISFKKGLSDTIGTNLFTAQQAQEMFEYVLDTNALAKAETAVVGNWEAEFNNRFLDVYTPSNVNDIINFITNLFAAKDREREEAIQSIYEYINRGQFSTPENPCEAWEKLNLRDKAEIVWHLLKALDK